MPKLRRRARGRPRRSGRPGKTSAPAAKAMPSARSTISSSGGRRPVANDDQGRGGNASSVMRARRAGQRKSRPVDRRPSPPQAAYMPLTFCSCASLGLTRVVGRVWFSSCCCCLPSAAASALAASLAASLASCVEVVRARLVHLGIIDLVLIVAAARRRAPARPRRPRQKLVFSCVSVPQEVAELA